jgi:hypothetical protein
MEPEGYEPLSGRAKWARRAFIALIALDTLSVVSGYFEYSLYGQDVITQEEVDTNDIRQGLVALLDFAAFVLAVVMFIRWFKRAYENLPALGVPELRFGSGWTIGSWFVPILNLFRPKQIANDIWRGSDPAAAPGRQDADWHRRPVTALLHWWWGLYLCSNYLDWFAVRIYWHGEDASSLRSAAAAGMVADSVSIVGLILALYVVRNATMRHEERAARLVAAPTAV